MRIFVIVGDGGRDQYPLRCRIGLWLGAAVRRGTERFPRDGPTGQVGEIFAMVDPEKPAVILHLVENIEVVPDQRRTFKIYDLGGPLRGYVIWTLKKTGDRTVVSYDIYYESVLSLFVA